MLIAIICGLAALGYLMAAAILHWAEPKPLAPCPWDDPRPVQLLKSPPHVSGDSE